MASTRTSPGPGGGTVSSRSVAVRGAVNQRALAFSSSPIQAAIRVHDASAEDEVHSVRFDRGVGEGEGAGEVAYAQVADGRQSVTQNLGRHTDGEPVDQPSFEEARDQGGAPLDHHRPDPEGAKLPQQSLQ